MRAAAILFLALIAGSAVAAPLAEGPAGNLAGRAMVALGIEGSAGLRVSGAHVSFELGARTSRHAHQLGRLLIVTAGNGLIQIDNGPVCSIALGDAVRPAPGVCNWHGAAPDSAMTHFVAQETVDGMPMIWGARLPTPNMEEQRDERS